MFSRFNDHGYNRCHNIYHNANHPNVVHQQSNNYAHNNSKGQCNHNGYKKCQNCRCCDSNQHREEGALYRSQYLPQHLPQHLPHNYYPHNGKIESDFLHTDYDYKKAIEVSKKEHDELERYNANLNNNDDNDLSWVQQITKVLDKHHKIYRYLINFMDVDVMNENNEMIITNNDYRLHHNPDNKYPRTHYDFIVGRGRVEPQENVNFPLNLTLASRNIVFIDPNPSVQADVKQLIQDVDFKHFGILRDQDVYETIDVRIIFDWSSFYCGALQCLPNIIKKIGRRCKILVPLNKDENLIPNDIKQILNPPDESKLFTITLADGRYPLFDWDRISPNTLRVIRKFAPSANSLADVVNPNKYVVISAFDDPDVYLY